MKPEGFRLRLTALWLIFGPIVACMWLAAVNYANNLVYAILYLIGSLSFISVFHTWRNLASLRIEHIRIHPAFAGQEVRMEIFLRNPTDHPVYGIHFARPKETSLFNRPFDFSGFAALREKSGRGVRVQAGDSYCAEIIFPATQRGVYRFETLIVRTSYPFGLVWASVNVPVNTEYYIYPQPYGAIDWPMLQPSGESSSTDSNRPGDDFSGVRAYMPGESLRHVDWKAFARGRPLSIKQFTGGSGHELWLDASGMGHVPLEERLSQLALWVVNAEKESVPYALSLGRITLPIGLGPVQSQRALEALAVAGLGTT